ncbi:hypothetical protein BDZ45DRAFT_738687 [Acephala macrosclerotiorum]|nr:hypothetical protein BDZ45DRAFT_738687 [Acephala macrosclerotiorum]
MSGLLKPLANPALGEHRSEEDLGEGRVQELQEKKASQKAENKTKMDGERKKIRVRLRRFFCCQCKKLANSSDIGVTCHDYKHLRGDCCSQGQKDYDSASENPYDNQVIPFPFTAKAVSNFSFFLRGTIGKVDLWESNQGTTRSDSISSYTCESLFGASERC